jgi:hypothetical protein
MEKISVVCWLSVVSLRWKISILGAGIVSERGFKLPVRGFETERHGAFFARRRLGGGCCPGSPRSRVSRWEREMESWACGVGWARGREEVGLFAGKKIPFFFF